MKYSVRVEYSDLSNALSAFRALNPTQDRAEALCLTTLQPGDFNSRRYYLEFTVSPEFLKNSLNEFMGLYIGLQNVTITLWEGN